MGQWEKFKEQCRADYDEWRESVDPHIGPFTEPDLEQWSLHVYENVTAALGNKAKVKQYFSQPNIRAAYLGNIKRVRKTWRKKYKYAGSIKLEEFAEWTYGIIFSLHNQDKRLVMAELNTTLKQAKAPHFLKRKVLRILESSPFIKGGQQ